MGADDKQRQHLRHRSEDADQEVVHAVGPQPNLDRGDGPRGTPAVDGDLVYGIGSQGNLICVKASSGEKVWLKELKGKDIGGDDDAAAGATRSRRWWTAICSSARPAARTARWPPSTRRRRPGLAHQGLDRQGRLLLDRGGRHRRRPPVRPDDRKRVAGVDAKDGKLALEVQAPRQHGRHPHADRLRTTTSSSPRVTASAAASSRSPRTAGKFQGQGSPQAQQHDQPSRRRRAGGRQPVRLRRRQRQVGLQEHDDRQGRLDAQSKQGKMFAHLRRRPLYCYGENDGTVLLVEASPEGYKEKGSFKIPEQTKRRARRAAANLDASGRRQRQAVPARPRTCLFCYDVKDGTASR